MTDARNNPPGRSAPFVRKLGNVSVDRVLSGTSEVPSALARRSTPRLAKGPKNPKVRVPTMNQPMPTRTSKISQRLVLIPEEEVIAEETSDQPGRMGLSSAEQLSKEERADKFPRVTSYLVADHFRLKATAEYVRVNHSARVRMYDEALFVDYLLPLRPGNGVLARVQSSLGDNRTMERLIDISEQGDHHYEYFSELESEQQTGGGGEQNEGFDPSEPQDFSPRGHSPPTFGRQAHHKPTEQDEQLLKQQEEGRISRFLSHAAMFVFNYGVVVFWNFTESQEKAILADLTLQSRELAKKAVDGDDVETEEFNFTYTQEETRPRIFNDMITLTNNNHMIKLAMAHAIAQSTKLSGFEERMQSKMRDVKTVPKTLALTGELGMKREQVLRIYGALFKLRVDVNLSSNVLDTPDIFWESEPSLAPVYAALREYLEIDQRILVLNERCSVFLELTQMLADSVAEFNMDRITVVIIVLILLSIVVSLTEIAVRYLLLRRIHH